MYVCVCNGVSDRDVAQAKAQGCRSVDELAMRTGCGTTCGCCRDFAQQLLDEGGVASTSAPFSLPMAVAA
jgi:bacterioferritin-associated ferredoxin